MLVPPATLASKPKSASAMLAEGTRNRRGLAPLDTHRQAFTSFPTLRARVDRTGQSRLLRLENYQMSKSICQGRVMSLVVKFLIVHMYKGETVSEALILESVNPQYDERLFIEFPPKYKIHVVYKYCFE